MKRQIERRETLKTSSPNISGSKGMSKPKRRISSEFALRRSPRLLGLSSFLWRLTMTRRSHLLAKSAIPPSGQIAPPPKPTQCSQRSPEKSAQTSSLKPSEHVGKGSSARKVYKPSRNPDYGRILRSYRATDAFLFETGYEYCGMEKRTLIRSGKMSSYLVKSHGITSVAVHGMESICVVYRNEAVDKSRVDHHINGNYVMKYFGKYIISLMEDLADSSSKLSPELSDPIRNGRPGSPFAFVSVIQGTDSVQEQALDVVLDGSKAVDFLLRETDRDSAFTPSKTKKTALSAFQLLFQQKLKASDIQIMYLRGSTIDWYEPSFYATHLDVFKLGPEFD